jgi:hypothetical protein
MLVRPSRRTPTRTIRVTTADATYQQPTTPTELQAKALELLKIKPT